MTEYCASQAGASYRYFNNSEWVSYDSAVSVIDTTLYYSYSTFVPDYSESLLLTSLYVGQSFTVTIRTRVGQVAGLIGGDNHVISSTGEKEWTVTTKIRLMVTFISLPYIVTFSTVEDPTTYIRIYSDDVNNSNTSTGENFEDGTLIWTGGQLSGGSASISPGYSTGSVSNYPMTISGIKSAKVSNDATYITGVNEIEITGDQTFVVFRTT